MGRRNEGTKSFILISSHSRRPSGTTGGRLAMPGNRGTFVGELTEQQYGIIDAAEKVAAELGTDVTTVAWKIGRLNDEYWCHCSESDRSGSVAPLLNRTGRLWAADNPPRGARFCFTLPANGPRCDPVAPGDRTEATDVRCAARRMGASAIDRTSNSVRRSIRRHRPCRRFTASTLLESASH